MAFWTPMAGRVRIGAPPRMVGQARTVQRAIDARFAELTGYNLATQEQADGRLWVSFATTVPLPHRRHCIMHWITSRGVWITYWEAYCNSFD